MGKSNQSTQVTQPRHLAAVIGTAPLARHFVQTIIDSPEFRLTALCAPDADSLVDAFNIPDRVVKSAQDATTAAHCGQVAICEDLDLLLRPTAVQLVIDTGTDSFEVAQNAAAALAAGAHVLISQQDTLDLYGPWLHNLSRQAGRAIWLMRSEDEAEAVLSRAHEIMSGQAPFSTDTSPICRGPKIAYAAENLPAGTALEDGGICAHIEPAEANRPFDIHEGLPLALCADVVIKRPVASGLRIRLTDCIYSENAPRFALWRAAQNAMGHTDVAAE